MTPDPALLLRAVPDGLWLLDTDGRTLFANEPLLIMLGRSADQMPGFSAYDVLDESGAAVLRERLAERLDPAVPPAPGTRGDREGRDFVAVPEQLSFLPLRWEIPYAYCLVLAPRDKSPVGAKNNGMDLPGVSL